MYISPPHEAKVRRGKEDGRNHSEQGGLGVDCGLFLYEEQVRE